MAGKNKSVRTITLCSSADFFKELIEIGVQLEARGFKIKLPLTAVKMKKSGDFNVAKYKTWFKNPNDYKKKAFLTKSHFDKVRSGDAILVVNNEKRGISGYIGGATLMEMAIASYLKKPIYVLNGVLKKSLLYEEIMGLKPIFINGDLSKIE